MTILNRLDRETSYLRFLFKLLHAVVCSHGLHISYFEVSYIVTALIVTLCSALLHIKVWVLQIQLKWQRAHTCKGPDRML